MARVALPSGSFIRGYAVGVTLAFLVLAISVALIGGDTFSVSGLFRSEIDQDLLIYDASAYGQSRLDKKQAPYDAEFEARRRENPGSFESLGRYPEGFQACRHYSAPCTEERP